MEILFIGGTGNISSEVAAKLYNQGHAITVVTTGKRAVPPEYKHIKADRNAPGYFIETLKSVAADVVIDFFAFVPEHLKIDYTIFNGKIKQFIFISSATVYEKPHTVLPITEKTPRNNPFWPYAQNKIACEEYLERIHSHTFPVTIVRPSHTFGKTWIPSPINGCDFTIANRILSGKPIVIHDNGESLWTLTAASDFAAGFCGLVGNEKAVGEAFHITSDEALPWNKIYDLLGDALGKKPSVVHIPSEFLAEIYPESRGMLMGDKREHGVFDNAKIRHIVPDFRCQKSFSVAIRESVSWFREVPTRMAIDKDQDSFISSLIEKWQQTNS